MVAIIGVKENNDNKVLIRRQKRELVDILDSDNMTIEILDVDYEDIENL